MTQNLGRIGEIHSYTSVWIPNMILFVLVFYSSYKMQKEVPFQAMGKLNDFFINFYEIFRNIFKKNIKPKVSARKAANQKKSIDTILELRKDTTDRK